MSKTQIFEKKGKFSSEEKVLAYFFLPLSNMTNWGNNLSGYKRYFDKYCASYKIISLGPKKSRTKILKIKAILQKKKTFWTFCSHVTHFDRHGVTFCKSPRCNLAIVVQYKRSFLCHPRVCWKQKFLNKKQTFQWKKYFGLIFFVISNMKNVREQLIRVHKVFWQILW